MFNDQVAKSLTGQVVESSLVEENELEQEPVFIPITVTATFSVPSSYLDNTEANTEVFTVYMNNIATEFFGTVVSLDIK